jgi:hypothetical protein
MPAEPTPAHIDEARRLVRGRAQDLGLQGCHVAICTPCLDGAGGECHTPGCLFWMVSAPDVPIRERAEASDGHHIAEALAAKESGAAAARARTGAAEEMAACTLQIAAEKVEAAEAGWEQARAALTESQRAFVVALEFAERKAAEAERSRIVAILEAEDHDLLRHMIEKIRRTE